MDKDRSWLQVMLEVNIFITPWPGVSYNPGEKNMSERIG